MSQTPSPAAEHPADLWTSVVPKKHYDAVIVGGGGHGLAAAYYLACRHGVTNVAVLEAGALATGNVARNTAIIRSNYLLDESAMLFDRGLRLWEGLQEELEYDLLFEQRGVITLAHDHAGERAMRRLVAANRLMGIDNEWVTADDLRTLCPLLDPAPDARYPVVGAAFQPRAGIAKHDHVAWAYARGAARRGVDIVEGCAVHSIEVQRGRVVGIQTSLGPIATDTVALATAGGTAQLARTVGLRLPVQHRPLQALVSGLHEQRLDHVVMSGAVHVYVSQAHKGELVMGAGVDGYTSHVRRGAPHVLERQLAAAVELFPAFAAAGVLRTWAGTVDVTPDASPILGATGVEGLVLNCGWGTGGFKATPVAGELLAHHVATGAADPLAVPFGLDRFAAGRLIDEHVAAGVAH